MKVEMREVKSKDSAGKEIVVDTVETYKYESLAEAVAHLMQRGKLATEAEGEAEALSLLNRQDATDIMNRARVAATATDTPERAARRILRKAEKSGDKAAALAQLMAVAAAMQAEIEAASATDAEGEAVA